MYLILYVTVKRYFRLRYGNVKTWERRNGFGDLRFRSRFDIIEAAEKGLLPDKIMLNTHPQFRDDNPIEWAKELIWQNVKNVVKRFIIRRLRRPVRLWRISAEMRDLGPNEVD